MSKLKVLTAKENEHLLKQYKNNRSLDVRNELVIGNLKLVYYTVNRYMNGSTEKEDLLQQATILLMQAIEKYNPDRGVLFATFAITVIRNGLYMQHSKKQRRHIPTTSLQQSVQDLDGNSDIFKEIEDQTDIERDYVRSIEYTVIRDLLKELKDRDQLIIKLSCGLDFNKIHTHAEIARMLGVSRQFVSKSVQRIKLKLKKELLKQGFNETVIFKY